MPKPIEPSSSVAPRSARHLAGSSLERRPLPRASYPVEASAVGIVTATIRLWSADVLRHARVSVLPLAAVVIPGFVVGGVLIADSWSKSTAGAKMPPWEALLAGAIMFLALASVAYIAGAAASVILAEDRAVSDGSKPARECFYAGLAATRRIGGAIIIVFAFWLALGAALGAPTALLRTIDANLSALFSVVTSLASTAAWAWLAVRIAPMIPVFVIEERGFFDGVRRTWELTRGNAAMIFGAGLIFGVGAMFASFAIGVLNFIPILGTLATFVILVLVSPLAHVLVFSIYAACVKREQTGA